MQAKMRPLLKARHAGVAAVINHARWSAIHASRVSPRVLIWELSFDASLHSMGKVGGSLTPRLAGYCEWPNFGFTLASCAGYDRSEVGLWTSDADASRAGVDWNKAVPASLKKSSCYWLQIGCGS